RPPGGRALASDPQRTTPRGLRAGVRTRAPNRSRAPPWVRTLGPEGVRVGLRRRVAKRDSRRVERRRSAADAEDLRGRSVALSGDARRSAPRVVARTRRARLLRRRGAPARAG